MDKNLAILAIESSCDETAAAVMVDGMVKSNIISTQLIHKQYGGVVPELASRMHQRHIIATVSQAMAEASVDKNALTAIGFTQGPGLLGPLLIGNCFAKALAFSLDIPLIGVHHIQAHVLANFIDEPKPAFPFLCLTASGGHTQILLVEDFLSMKVLGQTKDDAAGEAFDKIAKLLGLDYPGGVLIDQYAKYGDPCRFSFPKANVPGLDFSFSGIKTAFLYFVQGHTQDFIHTHCADICASIQSTLIQMLIDKLTNAIDQTGVGRVAIAGGVSANSCLRQRLKKLAKERHIELFIPDLRYCTDNAAMVAMAAHHKYLAQQFADFTTPAMPRMAIET